ncbi:MAG: tail fiber domain-containing protein [Nitrospirae bacterium]|nr:tail fiber domain-containing protein [Nitrospirota bacterium]
MKKITGIAVSLITAFLIMQSVQGYADWATYNSVSGMNSTGSISNLTTDNLTEGTFNKYYLDSRARAALSTSVPLSYNSSTGAFSLGTVPVTSGGTGLAATPAKGQMLIGNDNGTFKLNTLSAGSNVTITNDNGSVTIAASTGGAPTWGNIGGTLSSQTDLQTAFNAKEPSIATGTSGQWRNGTKNWFTVYSDNVTEGTTNLFYSNARARAALSSTGLIGYNNSTGAISLTGSTTNHWLDGTGNYFTLYTDNITEGSKLFWTQSRFNTGFAGMTADNLTEGTTNQYFTAARAVAAIGSGTSGKWYNGTNNFLQLYADNVTAAVKRTTTTLGDMMYDNGTALVRLAGNTSTTPEFLTSTGAASVATAPTWTGSTGSGNVVLDTAPTINGAIQNVGTAATLFASPRITGTTTAGAYGYYMNTGGRLLYGVDNSAGTAIGIVTLPYNAFVGQGQNYPLVLFANSSYMAMLPTGYTGFQNSAPGYMLTLGNGSSGALLSLNGTSGVCNHTPGASSETVSCTSDISLKDNITDAPSQLSILNNMRVRQYNIKSTGEQAIGLVAQEIQQTEPQLVHVMDDNKTLSVDAPSPWMIIKAMQEFEAEQESTMQAFSAALNNYNSVFVMPESIPSDNTTARVGVINGGLQLAPGTQTQPTCDNAHRGTHWFVAASDNSTDYEVVCAYVSGVIGWRKITWQ